MSSAENKLGRKGKVHVSTVIDAPVEAVWATAGRFTDLSWGGITGQYLGTPPNNKLLLDVVEIDLIKE